MFELIPILKGVKKILIKFPEDLIWGNQIFKLKDCEGEILIGITSQNFHYDAV